MAGAITSPSWKHRNDWVDGWPVSIPTTRSSPATAPEVSPRSDEAFLQPTRRGFPLRPSRKSGLHIDLTKRVGWCGCNWPMRSMSAEITVPNMK